jgi:hypothetical protein
MSLLTEPSAVISTPQARSSRRQGSHQESPPPNKGTVGKPLKYQYAILFCESKMTLETVK